MSRPTQVRQDHFRIRGYHPLWRLFPKTSANLLVGTGLVRVRSPLLTESRLMSFPPGTEMFQFPGFASPKPILFSLVIPLPFNSAPDCSGSKLNGEGGFPHSEIVGSKFAHNSPTLIAACHVLHRLCMPRHPPIALTSRLRIHTTIDNPVLLAGHRFSAVWFFDPDYPRRTSGVTQLDNHCCKDSCLKAFHCACARRLACRSLPPRHRFLEPIHNVKEERLALHIRGRGRETGDLHPWKYMRGAAATRRLGGAYRDRTDDLKLAKLALSQLS